MTSIPVTEARANLYQPVDDSALSHEPVQITGKRGLISSTGLYIKCIAMKKP
jgi:PHD/YefM family antitoxin component YafN of YafNO toxin-antitoxin module